MVAGLPIALMRGNRLLLLSTAALMGSAGATAALFWQHDPMDAVHVPADRYTETVRSSKATGPLRRHPSNPRYFTDGSGKAIYLTGSHTWSN